MPSADDPLRTSRHLPARPLIGPAPPVPVERTSVKSSTSNSPEPLPVNVRCTVCVPDGTPVSAVLTSANVVQLPVFGTAT